MSSNGRYKETTIFAIVTARKPTVRGWVGCLFLACVLIAAAPGVGRADPGDVGFRDGSISGTSTPTGTKRAESVLWWNDGSWWANMWDASSNDFHIFRLDTATQRWLDTGVTVDARANTHSDVLWDGTHLYVASHLFVNDGAPAVAGYPSYLFRFSYDPGARRYSLDPGFPADINNYKTETLVIDKDSTGKLWATWMQDNRIYVNRTVGGDTSWGTPFGLPAAGTSVTVDDNSAVIAFGGDRIGVMWSNQTTSADAMYFAVHLDGDPDTTWQASRTAIQGPATADDHMNLKSMATDAGGRVYAAVKTSFTSSSAPLIMLLVRDPASGDWSSYPIARVSDCPNRPIVLIDQENRVLHAFYTAPGPPGYSCNSSGGAIYEKTSPLDAISFPVGSGAPRIVDADSPYMHNVTSTKQNVDSTTGIAVLAANGHTDYYWHAYETIPPAATTPPAADFSAAPTSGTAPLNVQFHDLSTGPPSTWSWDFGDGGTSTLQNPTHTYASPGTYTVSLTASNSGGSDTKTRSGYISVSAPPPPSADFVGSPTSGTAPLAVSFTDLSSGSPTSWSWSFGDGGTSTLQNPTHTYTTAGTYTVNLTASNTSGSDTKTRSGYISVSAPPPPSANFAGSPTSGTAPLAVSFTDLSSGSPTSWSWSFGDGGTSTLQNPTHAYTTAGSYTVSLTVGNASGGDTKTVTDYVSVTPPPPPTANFAGTPTSGTAPLVVSFTDLSTGSPTSWSWSFGDGGTSTLQNPTHTYTTAGSYTVSLTVGNAGGGDTKTLTGYVNVSPPPPDFTLSVAPASAIVVRGNSTTFTVTVTPRNDFSGAVALSVTGLPTGTTGTFDLNPLNVPSGTTSNLTVATTDTTKQGVYVLTVAATGGGISHTTTLSLQIKRK
jgi:PKD repeat protein